MDGTKYVGMGVHTRAIGAAVRNSAGKVTKESIFERGRIPFWSSSKGYEEEEDHSHAKGLADRARTLRKARLDIRKYARRPAAGKFFPRPLLSLGQSYAAPPYLVDFEVGRSSRE